MMLNRDNPTLVRLFIAVIVAVIIAIYYLSEKRPFEYEGYENNINRLQRYDAELNEAIVQTRFGVVKNYEPIDRALKGIQDSLSVFKDELITSPNANIDQYIKRLDEAIQRKDNLSQRFKRINPVLNNAVTQFSTIMYNIIEQQESDSAVEEGLQLEPTDNKSKTIDQQSELLERSQILGKINNLFRGILVYINVRSEDMHTSLDAAVNDLRQDRLVNDVKSYPKLQNALDYADMILRLQPEITQVDAELFEVPIVPILTSLNYAYRQAYDIHQQRSAIYRIGLYAMLFLFLVVLRWAFNRLRRTVTTLHIEVQRKIKAEKALEETNRQLEQRVADRTQELTIKNSDLNQALGDLKEAQDQLIMQEKMASVGMLTTGIAHEIKNPLNFVNNFSDLSVELINELSEELKTNADKFAAKDFEYINEILQDLKTNNSKIKEHGERADNIVKNMLLHSQETSVQKEMIDLKILMNDNIQIALESFRAAQGKFDVKVEKEYDSNLTEVLAAPQSIGRVFIYVIDNALYAMREKQKTAPTSYEPTLRVYMTKQGETTVIKIRDNGTGIPHKIIDKIFEPFFTTKPTGRGNTGLGLSICYDTVVKQHKGEFRVASEEGEFTEFTIMLPTVRKTQT